jgi:hypothetical protein
MEKKKAKEGSSHQVKWSDLDSAVKKEWLSIGQTVKGQKKDAAYKIVLIRQFSMEGRSRKYSRAIICSRHA